ncbi:site-specific integrase [Nocardioides sp. GY 10127]|uniref:tyrosine-type recombinase/integrase n=1 Tax=Nocardioides sp. GY 10127 TaxID=2569762 RepID=UPI0010A93110|nr:site-specific integrase [Nocardioides sp. GY 10127]TIC84103.1 site-specific integrase [Nocardioides sp. GY 10127]
MASIARYTPTRTDGTKGRPIWRARYRDADGKEHARHFATKRAGQEWLNEVTTAVTSGTYVDPRLGKTPFRAFAEEWERVQVSSEGTARIVDNALRLHLVPALGETPIVAVRRTRVQGLVKELEQKGLAPGTVRNVYEVLAKVFAAAVDDRLIPSSPCARIRLPRDDRPEVQPPTVEEVERVAGAIGDRWRALVILLAGSGLRIGEARGLMVGDVDFLRRTIRVERQRMQSGQLQPLKSKASRRTLPAGTVLLDELAAHLATFGPADLAAPLFVDEFGDPLSYTRWKRLLASACREADVDVTAHGFRHFYASALIAGGASVKQVQVALGHASATITLRTYAHLFPGDEDRTRNVMDAALGPLARAADRVRTEAASSD